MNDQSTLDAVRQSVTVPLSQEQAFELFVEEFGSWWPLESHHIGEHPARQVIIEPREGGRWYERDESGAECEWGRVLIVERPARILLAWHLSPRWEFDPDPERATEIEVTFEAQGEGSTIVALEHRGFEVLAEAGPELRKAVAGEAGWPMLLGRYAAKAV